jgi:hypothetical protein
LPSSNGLRHCLRRRTVDQPIADALVVAFKVIVCDELTNEPTKVRAVQTSVVKKSAATSAGQCARIDVRHRGALWAGRDACCLQDAHNRRPAHPVPMFFKAPWMRV